MQKRERKAPFVRLFNKPGKGIVCPAFWVLAWANSCPYRCSYCYLQGTFRFFEEPVLYTNLGKLEEEVRAWLLDTSGPAVLNTGELTDSLALAGRIGLYRKLVPLFASPESNPSGCVLLLVTKSTEIRHLLELEPTPGVIVSFSVNAFGVAERYEQGAPHPRERLQAALELQEAGWRIRLRIDPMIPVPRWRDAYGGLAEEIVRARLRPERITLGVLRFFPAVAAVARRRGRPGQEVFSFATSRSPEGRLRPEPSLRVEMYGFVLRRLHEVLPRLETGLCKEEKAVREAVGIEDAKCNCTL